MNDFTCNQFKDMIFNYIDNELNTDTKLKMEEHAAQCSECKTEYQKTKHLLETIKDSRYTANNQLYASLIPQLAGLKKRSILNKMRVYGSIAGAAVITILMLVYIMPMIKSDITNNSVAFDNFDGGIIEMQAAAEEEIVIEETVQNDFAGEIAPSRIALFSDTVVQMTMTDYLNVYAPEYIDNTEALYISYGEVDIPESITVDKVENETRYSVYVIDKFTNIAFDIGEVTEYSNVYYSENNGLRYLIILKLYYE